MATVNDPPGQKRRTLVLVCVVSLAMGVLVPVAAMSQPEVMNWSLYVAATLMVSTFLVSSLIREGLDALLNPGSMVCFGFLLFYSAGPLLRPSNYQVFYQNGGVSIYSALYYLVSASMFTLGASIPHGAYRSSSSPKGRFHVARAWRRFAAVLLLYVSIAIMYSRAKGVSPLSLFVDSGYGGDKIFAAENDSNLSSYLLNLWSWLSVSLAIECGILLALSKSKIGIISVFLVFCCVALSMYAIGSRWRFLYLASGMAMSWFSVRSLESPIRPLLTKMALALMIVVFMATQQVLVRNRGNLLSAVDSYEIAPIASFVDAGIDQMERFEAVRVSIPRHRPYTYGLTYGSVLFTWVPRSVWPSKPSDAAVYLAATGVRENPNASYGFIGEAYLNFGPLGVVAMSILLGYVSSRWKHYCQRHASNPTVRLLYFCSLPLFTFVIRGSFHAAVAGMLYPMIVALVALPRTYEGLESTNATYCHVDSM